MISKKTISSIRIAMGAYTFGATILTYFCIFKGMQPAVFWYNLFTSYITSEAILTYTNKFTFLFTLLTLILPALIVIGVVGLFEKKS
ncbi:hypothetical protein [Cytophaga aurantiaca]|uniref:hypothetical protein n=1 Tax=Cytophaga aurantiaca TaxID=29530 RepID=UPI000364C88A|nr:hypothetical protein [Cytophaga aurantiaca]